MRVETIKRNLYTFKELSEEAQQKAIENLYNINVDDSFWYEGIYEDAITIAGLMGITIDKIYFSGFSSQGEGACFEGSYKYKKGGSKAVQDFAPKDKELHAIAQCLQDLQRKNFYKLTAGVKYSGHYYHSGCTSIEVTKDFDSWEDIKEDTEESLSELLRDYMQWIYSQLNKNYEYLTGEEAIKETIESNEYEFLENGKLA